VDLARAGPRSGRDPDLRNRPVGEPPLRPDRKRRPGRAFPRRPRFARAANSRRNRASARAADRPWYRPGTLCRSVFRRGAGSDDGSLSRRCGCIPIPFGSRGRLGSPPLGSGLGRAPPYLRLSRTLWRRCSYSPASARRAVISARLFDFRRFCCLLIQHQPSTLMPVSRRGDFVVEIGDAFSRLRGIHRCRHRDPDRRFPRASGVSEQPDPGRRRGAGPRLRCAETDYQYRP
jgi:hypothetical protein